MTTGKKGFNEPESAAATQRYTTDKVTRYSFVLFRRPLHKERKRL